MGLLTCMAPSLPIKKLLGVTQPNLQHKSKNQTCNPTGTLRAAQPALLRLSQAEMDAQHTSSIFSLRQLVWNAEFPQDWQLLNGIKTQQLCQTETWDSARCKGCHQPPARSLLRVFQMQAKTSQFLARLNHCTFASGVLLPGPQEPFYVCCCLGTSDVGTEKALQWTSWEVYCQR